MNGFDNLSAMEIDPTSAIQEMVEQCMCSAVDRYRAALTLAQRTRTA